MGRTRKSFQYEEDDHEDKKYQSRIINVGDEDEMDEFFPEDEEETSVENDDEYEADVDDDD